MKKLFLIALLFIGCNKLTYPWYSGTLENALKNNLDNISSEKCSPGSATQADAQTQNISRDKIVSTDPPYFDNIIYSDLSDFFYIWLRNNLKEIYPGLFGTMYVPNATPSNTATFRMNATFRHYRTSCVPTGQQLGNCGLFTGAYLANAATCNWFTAPTTYSTNPYTFQGITGSSGVCNGNYLYDWRNYGYSLSGYSPATLSGSHGTITLPSAINYANAGFQWYAAIHATAFGCYGSATGGTSNFTATVTGQEYYTYYTYTNHVSSSSSTVNLGATFSVSGAGWSVGSTGFSTSNSANTHAESIRSSIASALPSGWSVSRSNNVVTVTAPAASGNVNDMSVSISNGSGVNGGTNPSPGNTSTVRPSSNVSGSGSTTTQGSGQTGNLTSATVTSGGNSTSVNLSNGASTDTAGSEIANAMNGLADTTATYDNSTNRMTVVAPGDTSVSLTNPNTLSVSKVSL